MSRIPSVKSWRVTVIETGEQFEIDTITKKMVNIIFRMDYPKYWGMAIRIGLLKK